MATIIDDGILFDVLAGRPGSRRHHGRGPSRVPVHDGLLVLPPRTSGWCRVGTGLAAAVLLDARLLVSTDAPLLRAGSMDLGVPYELV